MKYTVKSVYGISGESTHRSVRAAIRERDRREGDGWIVLDETGAQWDLYGGDPVMVIQPQD